MVNGKAPLKAVVVGCKMGRAHAVAMYELEEYNLAAICDLNEDAAKSVAEISGEPKIYSNYEEMLEAEKPDVVAIATPNAFHAPMTFQAVDAGVKAVYCEKPMAMNMGEARKMVDICKQKGVALAIGHQRRMTAPFVTMKRLMDEKAIGDVYLIRGTCAGDILSDGTHAIDTIMHLCGDADVKWVFGQVHRQKTEYDRVNQFDYSIFTGWRYGHAVESGGMAVFEFANGVRAEIFTGSMWLPGWKYQEFEVVGTKGRLWRQGDAANPPLLIQDEQAGGWREVPLDKLPVEKIFNHVYKEFASYIHNGDEFPMSGDVSIKGFEVVMAAYESARLRDKLELPLKQERFPLDIMIEEGQL